ncbi:MAG TPA: hypothetical protein PK760_09435, partial [Flavobacteriales bacterium]|nr:hypothetical protein [Flavobacteriales bacterium]
WASVAPPTPFALTTMFNDRSGSNKANYELIGAPMGPAPTDLYYTAACEPLPPVLDVNDVLVVINTNDATSSAMAQAYRNAWGIPAGNVVSVALGSNPNLASLSSLNAARTAINARGLQYTVLAMKTPSRYGTQSITSAITFGARNVTSLTVSPFLNYSGTQPRLQKGFAPSFLLYSSNYIRRTAHHTNPSGQSILLLANDQSGTPRGSARASQTTTGVTTWDNRNYSGIGPGVNTCNCISTDCWKANRNPGTVPIVAAYQSMFILLGSGNAHWAPGFYGDHVTSFGGYLPAVNTNGTNAQGQTPLTYELDKGASMSVGSVSEPWQPHTGYSPGSCAEQFLNVSIFHPLFIGGSRVGVAAWAAVKCPDRMLFAGDPLTAPFGQ